MAAVALPAAAQSAGPSTATPIQHVVVIFQENVSFDHYFGTYPQATNPAGEPAFSAAAGTPSVNGLQNLLTNNPNAAQPFRFDRSQALTCDMDHGYTSEQKAFNGGLMDQFVQHTGASYGTCDPKQVMGYYDGNTTTALWNYAQRYAMSDNSYGTTFGPSTPGAVNLISGQTAGATPANVKNAKGSTLVLNGTIVSDLDPAYDDCSSGPTASLSGKNVGDLLNAKGVTWGWFEGGFAPTATTNGKAVCGAKSVNVGGASVGDYIPHHQPFQYYASTANPHHLPPTSTAMIGQTDQANHQYDLNDFWNAVQAGNMPAVSFLKAKAYQDGHAGYSDPLDEQTFLVNTINRLEQSPDWSTTAIVINYDDSDGWYDHVLGPIVSQSNTPLDALTGSGGCGVAPAGAPEGRCGYGPRLPMMVISPYARPNFVDHAVSDQSSISRFIEDNWNLGRTGPGAFDAIAGQLNSMFDFSAPHAGTVLLDPTTGEPQTAPAAAVNATALQTAQSGSLAADTGGAFAYYQVASPTGAALTLTLAVGAHNAAVAHQIGMNVYQGGAKLGSVTATSTGLGDATTNDSPSLTVTPSATGGPVTIQVFNYSPAAESYTLTRS